MKATTPRAGTQEVIQGIFHLAVFAEKASFDALKMQFCASADGVAADYIPVKLNGVIHNRGELTQNNMNIGNAGGLLLVGVFERDG